MCFGTQDVLLTKSNAHSCVCVRLLLHRTTLGMLIVMVIAAFSSTMMCKAMALVPGNERFQVWFFSCFIDGRILTCDISHSCTGSS